MQSPFPTRLGRGTLGLAPQLVILLVLCGILVVVGGAAQIARLLRPAPLPAALVATPTEPPCDTIPDAIGLIDQLEREQKWGQAAATTQTALARGRGERGHPLCPEIREALKRRVVADSLEELYGQRFSKGDVVGQRASVERYYAARRYAQEQGVPFPHSRQIAERSYQIGQFLLAKIAFEEAISGHEVALGDQAQAQFASSTFYNLGVDFSTNPQEAAKQEGVRYLVTSLHIDRAFCVGRGEAWGLLLRTLGADEGRWPEPVETPVLGTATGVGVDGAPPPQCSGR